MAIMPAEVWYVLSVLLAPVGYVIQDAVADAMTVEAVPRVDDHGKPFDERRKLMHTTMQTLGRVAIIGGGIIVALINVYVFSRRRRTARELRWRVSTNKVYLMALVIPFVSDAWRWIGFATPATHKDSSYSRDSRLSRRDRWLMVRETQ